MSGTPGADAGGTGGALILVVEDDPAIADVVELYLRRDGHRVLQASDGERALELVAQRRPDLIILDLGLPGGIDGLEVCRRVRAGSEVPVVMLTARDDEVDRVVGLELGADDYVTKPFSPRELVVRVRNILRRTRPRPAAPVHRVGDVEVDEVRREVRRAGDSVPLTNREFDLLAYLCRHRGVALSRRRLLDGVWGVGWVGDERTVDVHVKQLRRKLPGLPLVTVRGLGYRLD